MAPLSIQLLGCDALSFKVLDLGSLSYDQAYAEQQRIHSKVVSGENAPTLVLVEHPAVLTLGAGFNAENLLLSEQDYAARGIEIRSTDRGGDITYHGPGQLVAYPIFDLKVYKTDLHWWLRSLEKTVIDMLGQVGITASTRPPHTGVWVEDEKVCALGIKVKRWVSMHGIALNCDNDLSPFDLIVPCGIRQLGVTSISQLLARRFTVEEAKPLLLSSFECRFGTR